MIEATGQETAPLLELRNLKKYYPIYSGIFSRATGHVKAVDDVSLSIRKGEILGLVGESGCGKTTLGRMALGLIEPTEGSVLFENVALNSLTRSQLRQLRRHIQIIFQDPYASLNPSMPVGEIIGEPLLLFEAMDSVSRENRVAELMQTVGLEPRYLGRYPHEFSGGQRQRVGIARALALNPSLVICDEPVSALDVSIQAQIINLLEELQEKLNLTYLFISHDLSVIKHISHRVGVMYLGKLVEVAPTENLYCKPLHPYTLALLSAVPIPDPDCRCDQIMLTGDVPSPINPPSGCRFQTRCAYVREVCSIDEPGLREVLPGHFAACHFVDLPDPSKFS